MNENAKIAAREAFKAKALDLNLTVRGYSLGDCIWNIELNQLLEAAFTAADQASDKSK